MTGLVPKDARIYVAGHGGLVGGAVHRTLREQGFTSIVVRRSAELDLTDQAATRRFFDEERPDIVIDAAARVGGIMANWEQPWEFVERNLLIELNVIGEAFRHDVRRLIFLGSSCIYPREAPQPLKEEYLLTGPLEETNRAYAIAKIGGIELSRSLNREYGTDYLSLMPTNLYGPGDNFDLDSSHVLPAMIRKFHDAKVALEQGGPGADGGEVTLWGSGKPRREFLYVEDVGLLNVGCGDDLTIRELAAVVQRVVGHEGPVTWDDSKPDGTPRKLMDVSRIKGLGWVPQVELEDGIRRTYDWFLENRA